MSDYILNKTDRMLMHDLRNAYLEEIVSPVDDYWEVGIVETSEFYLINDNCDNPLGYVVKTEENVLVQFYVIDKVKPNSREILDYVIKELKIQDIWVPSYNTYFFMDALDITQKHVVTDYLYVYSEIIDTSDIAYPLLKERLAYKSELKTVVEFYLANIPDSKEEWLYEYCEKWIDRQGIYLFFNEGDIIGAGEIRNEDFAEEYAYIGTVVNKNFRQQGFGTYITSKLRNIAIDRELLPICSVDIKNKPSLKMAKSSGFFPFNRIVLFEL